MRGRQDWSPDVEFPSFVNQLCTPYIYIGWVSYDNTLKSLILHTESLILLTPFSVPHREPDHPTATNKAHPQLPHDTHLPLPPNQTPTSLHLLPAPPPPEHHLTFSHLSPASPPPSSTAPTPASPAAPRLHHPRPSPLPTPRRRIPAPPSRRTGSMPRRTPATPRRRIQPLRSAPSGQHHCLLPIHGDRPATATSPCAGSGGIRLHRVPPGPPPLRPRQLPRPASSPSWT